MAKKSIKYNTICEIDVENLNLSIEELEEELIQENSQKMGVYIHHEFINDEEGNPKTLKLKCLYSFFCFCDFIQRISNDPLKDFRFSKIWGDDV